MDALADARWHRRITPRPDVWRGAVGAPIDAHPGNRTSPSRSWTTSRLLARRTVSPPRSGRMSIKPCVRYGRAPGWYTRRADGW